MSWSRRSHRHNRASDDDLFGDWAARDQPSGSYSGYTAGNSHTQQGSHNPGYGSSSSYTTQNSYPHYGPADPNYTRSQQQQYQEQSGGYGSQRSQGYDSEEEEDFEGPRSQIRSARDPSPKDTRSALYATQNAEGSDSRIFHHLGTQGARLDNTERDSYGSSNQNRFIDTRGRDHGGLNRGTFVSPSSTSRQEEEARVLARAERDESYRTTRESGHGNRYRSQYSSGGGYY